MTVAAPSEDAVARELWSSFVSLLRAYTSAHGLNGPRQAILEVSADSVLVRAGERQLLVTRQGNQGSWQREQGQPIDFTLGDDGRITANGEAGELKTEEMDIVAERLAREIMR
ncbi:MAG: transcriptional regulator [Acidobacteriaceae bacterium]